MSRAAPGSLATIHFPLSAQNVLKWSRFADKGGIGRCVALSDKIAEEQDSLMFLQGDVIIVLQDLHDGTLFGYCEGVLGLLASKDVMIQGKLKRAVFNKRAKAKKADAQESDAQTFTAASEVVPIGLGFDMPVVESAKLHAKEEDTMEEALKNNLCGREVSHDKSYSSGSGSIQSPDMKTPQLDYSSDCTPADTPISIIQPSTPPMQAQPVAIGSPQSDYGDFLDLYRRSIVDEADNLYDQSESVGNTSLKDLMHEDSAAEHLGTLMADLSSSQSSAYSIPRKLSYPRAPLHPQLGVASRLRKEADFESPRAQDTTDHTERHFPLHASYPAPPPSPLRYASSAEDISHSPSPPPSATLKPGFRFPAPAPRSVSSPEANTRSRPTPIRVHTTSPYGEFQFPQHSSPAFLHPSPHLPYPPSPHLPLPPGSAASHSSNESFKTARSGSYNPPSSRKSSFPDRKYSDPQPQHWSPHLKLKQSYSSLPSAELYVESPISPTSRTSSSSTRPLAAKPSVELVRSKDAGNFEMVQPTIAVYDSEEMEEIDSPEVWKPTLESRAQLRMSMMVEAQSHGPDTWSKPRPSMASSRSSFSSSPKALKSTTGYRQKETKWLQLMSKKNAMGASKKSKVLKKLVRSGIPSSVRGKAWSFLANADEFQKDGVYYDLASRDDTATTDTIEKDLDELYSHHPLFQGSTSPYRSDCSAILRAYSVISPHLYHSSHCIIIAFLLQFSPAEDAFWLFIALSRKITFLQKSKAASIRSLAVILSHLLAVSEPKIAQLLKRQNIEPSIWIEAWILPLFTSALPFQTMVRVFDILLLEEEHFLIQVCLAMFDLLRDQLLEPGADILQIIKQPPEDLLDPHALLATALTIKVSDSAIRRLETLGKQQR